MCITLSPFISGGIDIVAYREDYDLIVFVL